MISEISDFLLAKEENGMYGIRNIDKNGYLTKRRLSDEDLRNSILANSPVVAVALRSRWSTSVEDGLASKETRDKLLRLFFAI